MRSLAAATLYPGVGLLEFCDLSVGRGTDTPFEILGAPYIDDQKLAAALNEAKLPGLHIGPIRFTPSASVFAKQECGGVRFSLTDRNAFRAADLGVVLATTLQRLYPEKLKLGKMATLLGDAETLDAIRSGADLETTRTTRDRGVKEFGTRRTPFLLYPR